MANTYRTEQKEKWRERERENRKKYRYIHKIVVQKVSNKITNNGRLSWMIHDKRKCWNGLKNFLHHFWSEVCRSSTLLLPPFSISLSLWHVYMCVFVVHVLRSIKLVKMCVTNCVWIFVVRNFFFTYISIRLLCSERNFFYPTERLCYYPMLCYARFLLKSSKNNIRNEIPYKNIYIFIVFLSLCVYVVWCACI